MAKRSFLSFLSSSFSGGETTTLLDLTFDKDDEPSKDHSDLSQLDLSKSKTHSPGLNFQKTMEWVPQIPIIGIGGAGVRILSQIVDRVEQYGMRYPAMAIDTDNNSLKNYVNISHISHIPGSTQGTAHQYRLAATRTKEIESKLIEDINSYISALQMNYKHEIVFIILGAGGTGVGAGIEIARMLIKMGKRPVPFLILPAKEEMTRIKFNAAVALYHFSFAPKDRSLSLTTICIDNEEFLSQNSKKYYSSVISATNERIAATLGDIISTTELESHAYSADLNEFLETFRDLKTIGVMKYLQVHAPTKPIGELVDKCLKDCLSMKVDIFTATRGYYYISSKIEQIPAEDYRNLMLKFENSDIFNKLYEIDRDDEFFVIRGIFTGLDYPESVVNLLQMAEDVRVEILNREVDTQNQGKVNPKIDRLNSNEEIDVKTGQELHEIDRSRGEGEEV